MSRPPWGVVPTGAGRGVRPVRRRRGARSRHPEAPGPARPRPRRPARPERRRPVGRGRSATAPPHPSRWS
uniref:Uncharacterized protein n=1 Tax=Eiseniibacteriota bacterium TaxID=2212470 RepID=A0A832I2E2_UNCEI